ncbi:hypothetical protein Nisw_08225 [Candidatus Nitrosopumilus sp. SW]|uniref:hypothetical protein n=1 Tax=Candidatus Nitrosopumilus sp. SW TaxID=2508726 RepID=UPI001151405D|nr:hypothetical protein [Candidatus Nitrosopumilus sp. SW]QDI89509.1 hypothetical protein Nisw_08225 [Candidatus Nitrosopumilus sp. SW]
MLTKQTDKRLSRRTLMALLITGMAVTIIFTITPWNIIPTQVTEEVTVLAITENGCVGESQYGVSVVVPECNAQVGDTVSAIFYVPSMETNGYLEELDKRQNPMVDAWDRDVSGAGFSP